jgi:hypothetical protein
MSNIRGVSIVGAGFGGLGVAEQLAHVIITNLLNHKENIWREDPFVFSASPAVCGANRTTRCVATRVHRARLFLEDKLSDYFYG